MMTRFKNDESPARPWKVCARLSIHNKVSRYALTRAFVKQNLQQFSTGASSPPLGVTELVIALVGIETEPSAGYCQQLRSAGGRDEGSRVFGPQQNRELSVAGALHSFEASDPPKSCRGRQAKPRQSKTHQYCVGEVWPSLKWSTSARVATEGLHPKTHRSQVCRATKSGGGYSGRCNYV
jgi:hypothetical protein